MADLGELDTSPKTAINRNSSTTGVEKITSNLENTQIDDENESSENKSQNVKSGEDGDKSVASTPGSSNTTPDKIEILLKAVGNAPILRKKKFLLDRNKNVHYIIDWLKKYMKLEPSEQIFLYINQEFAPSPDAEIGTIYDCFKTSNHVIFHYCTTQAWG